MANTRSNRSNLNRANKHQQIEDALTCAWRDLRRRAMKCGRSSTGLFLKPGTDSGYAYCFEAGGPIDRGPHIQFGLPPNLHQFCTKTRGHAGASRGVRWDKEGYESAEDAARDFAHMMNEVEYFIQKMWKNKDRY